MIPRALVHTVLALAMSTSLAYTARSAERLSLNEGWRFYLGDIPLPSIKGHAESYKNAKAGVAWGAAGHEYDDSDWRVVNLPHDWVVEGPFDKDENLSQGYRPRGIAWYRRYFKLPDSDKGRQIELQFDGMATYATVWVNGIVAHRSWCGYTPLNIDITPFVNYGDEVNYIAIRVNADAQEGWWYEGGGIYRNAWLVKRNPVHIVTYGVYANPVKNPDGTWSLPVEVTMNNIEHDPADVTVKAELLDPAGLPVASGNTTATVPVLNEVVATVPLTIASPKLWSIDTPTLYTTRVTVTRNGTVTDEAELKTGFRTIRFDPEQGFFLNDQHVKLKGTCNHQDHAGVGVAVPESIWDFRVRRLKEMGSNAYRCAHNPPAPEFLAACDRQGMLVMDENRNFNPTPDYLDQLRLMVRRDRNHPSVILWSVFNEEPMQGTAQGREMVRHMVAEVHRWDRTRPITAAMNGGMGNPEGVFQAVDVMGFNYAHGQYDSFHKKYPNLPITSSEDTSAFMTRGEFETDKARNVIASYDDDHAGWGLNQRDAWKVVAERPFLAGGFVWTGFDYRGEPQRLSWPSVSSVFGILDLCGFPKTAYYIRQAMWIQDKPVLAIAPHWNWPGREGKPIRVIAMSNAKQVELFLNGRSQGTKDVPEFSYAEWQVPYEPGKLEAVASNNGREVARTVVETAGPAVALTLEPDRPSLAADGRDAMPITVSAVDAAGRVVPLADPVVTFEVSGPASNIGHGNGDHNCHDPEKGPTRKLFHGLAQLIVQATTQSGDAVVRATAAGLKPAELKIPVTSATPIPGVPVVEPVHQIATWRVSPTSDTKPDPQQKMSDADMNSWFAVKPGALQDTPAGKWALYRASFSPWRGVQAQGGELVLPQVAGRGEVWVDGVQAAVKTDPAPGEIKVALPAKSGPRVVSVVLQAPDTSAGTGLKRMPYISAAEKHTP